MTAGSVAVMDPGTPQPARTSRSWVSWLALFLAAVAVVLGALALLRPPPPAPLALPTTAAPPTERPEPAAVRNTCNIAVGATEAIARERRPFLDTPPQWEDPSTIAALTRVQAAALVELEAMRAAVGPSTPPELTDAITEYRSSILDMLDADTRRLSAAVSNAASTRAFTAAETIEKLCKVEG